MSKAIFTFFFFLLLTEINAQRYSGTWNGSGEYPYGQAMKTVMQKMGAAKKMVLTITPQGKATGSLTVTYDRSRTLLNNDAVDQSFTISGSYDSSRQLLLLILTHIKASPNSSSADQVFKKPDSIYYSIQMQQMEDKMLMTGIINSLANRNATAEWIGSSQGVGLGMNVSDAINMHLLPLRFKLENEQAKKPAVIIPVIAKKDSVASRKIEIQHTIVLDTSFIKLDLYDNGEIDGDIATLILDGKTIIESQLLSAKAATLSLNLSKEPAEHILELFANNMGSIPPNTALLVLTCKKKRYEINLSSNGTVNGSVKLVFKHN